VWLQRCLDMVHQATTCEDGSRFHSGAVMVCSIRVPKTVEEATVQRLLTVFKSSSSLGQAWQDFQFAWLIEGAANERVVLARRAT
jgi:hypothetical protein